MAKFFNFKGITLKAGVRTSSLVTRDELIERGQWGEWYNPCGVSAVLNATGEVRLFSVALDKEVESDADSDDDEEDDDDEEEDIDKLATVEYNQAIPLSQLKLLLSTYVVSVNLTYCHNFEFLNGDQAYVFKANATNTKATTSSEVLKNIFKFLKRMKSEVAVVAAGSHIHVEMACTLSERNVGVILKTAGGVTLLNTAAAGLNVASTYSGFVTANPSRLVSTNIPVTRPVTYMDRSLLMWQSKDENFYASQYHLALNGSGVKSFSTVMSDVVQMCPTDIDTKVRGAEEKYKVWEGTIRAIIQYMFGLKLPK